MSDIIDTTIEVKSDETTELKEDTPNVSFNFEATESARELLSQEEMESFAQLSLKQIMEDHPELDENGVGIAHSYTHTSGTKISTYCTPGEDLQWNVYLGLEDEIQMLLAEFQNFQNKPKPIVNEKPKVGRNQACPCGSTKKYKKCCLR